MKRKILLKIFLVGAVIFFSNAAFSAVVTANISQLGFNVIGSGNMIDDVEIAHCEGGSCPWVSCSVAPTAYDNHELLNLLVIARFQNTPIKLTYQITSGCQISSVTLKRS